MRKKIVSLMVALVAVTFVTSCSENEKISHVNSTNYDETNLVLNYSGNPIVGKAVTVDFYTENANINIIGAIIPGLDFINLGSVSYVGDKDTFTFEGTKEVEKSIMTFAGSVKAGVCTLDLTYELADKSLSGDWFLDLEYVDAGKLPFNLVWESTSEQTVLDIPMDELTALVSGLVSIMVIEETAGIKLLDDGNIQAMDAEGTIIPVLNTAIYSVKDTETIKVLLQIGNIISETTNEVTKSGSNSDLIEMLKTGIDVKYNNKVEGKLVLTFVINEQMRGIITPLMPTLINSLLGEDFANLIVPSIVDMLDKTTKMELSLNLSDTKPINPEAPAASEVSAADMFKNALSSYKVK